ncbi:MAG: PAS domain S-box protein [Spirochaetes bacterium]|nr:PAS domain S-box protein [Spirochaetota bacterium]
MLLDIKTLFFVYILICLSGVITMIFLWLLNRKRSPEIVLWLVSYILQFAAVCLILLRDIVPDVFSIVPANILIISSLAVLYEGYKRYLGVSKRQFRNIAIIIIFAIIHSYFTCVKPALLLRNINLAAGIIIISLQIAWFMIYKARKHTLKIITRPIGITVLLLCINKIFYIFNNLPGTQGDNIFKDGKADSLFLFADAFIALTLLPLIVLLVNRRMSLDREKQIDLHRIVENELKSSEAKLIEAQAIAELGNWELDLVSGILIWSEGIFNIFGIDPVEFDASYDAFLGAVHPDDREMVDKAYTESLEKKEPYEISHRLLMKDGRVKWVKEICRTSYDDDGNALKSVGIVQDITEQKKTEEELSASRLFLEELIDYSATGITIKDTDGHYTFVNRIWEEDNKIERKDALGKTDEDLFPEEKAVKIRQDDMHVIESRKAAEFELVFGCGDNEKYILNVVFPVKNKEGIITGTCAIGTDITERKLMEEELKKNRQFLSILIDHSSAGFCVKDMSGRYVLVNRKWEKDTGFKRGEVIGKTDEEIYPDNRERALKYMTDDREVMESGNSKEFEFQIGDRIILNNVYPMIDDQGMISGICSVGTDITQLKQAEKEIIESRTFLSDLIDHSSTVICIKDLEGRYTLVNKKWERESGFSREYVIGKTDFDLFPEETAKSIREDDLEVMKSGITKEREFQRDHVYGIRYYLTIIYPVKNFKDEITGVCAIGTDITERKKAEDELSSSRRFLSDLIEHSDTAIVVKDLNGRFELVNRKWEEHTGFNRLNVIGKTHTDFFPDGLANQFFADDRKIIESGITNYREITVDNKEGSRYLLNVIFPIRNDNNEITGTCAIATDITERKLAEKMLAEERQRLAYILEATNVGAWEWNIEKNEIIFNERWAEIIGYSLKEIGPLTNETPSAFIHPDDYTVANEIFDRHFKNKIPFYECEVRMRHKNGSWIWVLDKGKVVKRADNGRPLLMAGANQDITDRKQAEELLGMERQRLGYILEGTNAGTWEWNYQTHEFKINDRWAEMIGYTIEELEPVDDQIPRKFIHPDDFDKVKELVEKHIKKEILYYESEVRMRHKNGSLVWVLARGKVVTWTDSGEPLLICGTQQDINLRKIAEEKIIHMATHDILTGLPTINLVRDRLSVAMSAARRRRNIRAVMFIDLDGFKKVNDSLGHNAGDRVLKLVAERLQSSIRETDTVARLGGDEFLIIAAELNFPQDTELIAKKAITQIALPIELEEQTFNISASIGIAFYSDDCTEMEQLIKLADEAMYTVKKSGKNSYAFANKPVLN